MDPTSPPKEPGAEPRAQTESAIISPAPTTPAIPTPGAASGTPPYPRSTDMAWMAERCYPDTLAFYRYWLRKAGSRPMPSRADLDPAEMKPWLTGIQLIDVHEATADQPRRLVYRLVGEAEVGLRGYNPTGRTVAEAAIGKLSSDPMGNYSIVIDQKLPVYDWSKIDHPNGFLIGQECVLLPLSDDGFCVNMVVTYGKVVPISRGSRRR
jgi:hypothetical protein